MANRLCLACDSGNHLVVNCPFKRTWNATPAPPALPAPPVRKNPGSIGRGALLPSQQHVCNQAQKGVRVVAGRERGQSYNLIAEEAEASGEVVAYKILVHSSPILALFNSGASRYFISNRFITLHSVLLVCMDDQ